MINEVWLATRHEIASVLAAQGKPADAEAEFRQILDARLRVLGPDHPAILAAVNWLKHLQLGKDQRIVSLPLTVRCGVARR